MAAINPRIIEDTIHLIETYQRSGEGSAFRRRFDMAIARDVNATYKNRPLKLYFEVLASTNKAKFGESYKDIRRLVKHDNEGIIKKTLLEVNSKDLSDLTDHEKQAKKDINSMDYPPEEIDKINKIEEAAKDRVQKREQHAKRLDQTEYFAVTKKTPAEIKEEEKLVPGATPELKKSYQPASEEEKTRLTAALNQSRKEVPKNVLVGPTGAPLRNIVPEAVEEAPVEISFEPRPEEAPPSTTPSLPQIPSTGFAKRIFKTEAVETAGAETGARIAAGRAAAGAIRAGGLAVEGGAATVARLGAGAAARAGVSTLAKLGFSAATGLATGGVGFVVGLAITAITTFGDQIKSLGKLMLQVTIAIVAAFVLMFFWNWGEKMNSLLPPYTVGEAAELPTVTPTPTGPTSTPAPGVTATCPVSGGSISCGSQGTNYYACAGGHCSPSYRAANPGLCETYPATAYGMDILGAAGSQVYIPTVKNPVTGEISNITCGYVYKEVGFQGQTIIQYRCSIDGDTASPRNYFYIQFHHLRNSVPPGPYQTGSVAGYIWDAGDHTHVQIGLNGVCQGSFTSSCVAPESYLQCR